jgi:hypothetical protein
LRISVALFLFDYWLLYYWIKTVIPVGIWIALQADYILLTPWPPGPLDRVYWYLISLGSRLKLKGTTGIITTEAVDDCKRPFD